MIGNIAAKQAFLSAAGSRAMHHGWLFAGPAGVGKAGFAKIAAARILANAADPATLLSSEPLPVESVAARLLAAGSHPDFKLLERLPKDPDKPDQDVARSIPIAQIRALQPMLANKPALSARRVVIIDAIDDLERAGANALLKNLEEPPAGTIFILISHAPGRLLPTIRSRCRLLRFGPLDEAEMRSVLDTALPGASAEEQTILVRAGAGSPGRAIDFAGLEMASLEREMLAIAKHGDPDNAIRSRLAKALATKSAQPRYEAFLARAPSLIADAGRTRSGEPLRIALDAYADARHLVSVAVPQSFDAATTAFEMAGIIARLAQKDGLQSGQSMP